MPNMAERQGFEPWEGYKPSTVFKTAAFDHSATSPDPADTAFNNPSLLKTISSNCALGHPDNFTVIYRKLPK